MRNIKRHEASDIFIHWFNAGSWLVLLVSGLGLIKNERLNPLGAWLPDALRALFGGGSTGGAVLLAIHEVAGVLDAWALKVMRHGEIDLWFYLPDGTVPGGSGTREFDPK